MLTATADSGADAVIGEEAHIVGRSAQGPRGNDDQEMDRDGYANLILLCPNDHTLVDDVPTDYPVEDLRSFKASHERWVAHRLSVDRPVELLADLPSAPPRLVNRIAELEDLGRAVERSTDSPWASVVILRGMHGVGKSTLAAHWVMRIRERFDVVLTADFSRRRRGGLVDLAEILGGFLRALGVLDGHLPGTFEHRRTMFADLTMSRRVLVLIDDVDLPAQVSALQPSGAGSMVVLTTPHRLDELVISGADEIVVEPFEREAAVALLSDIVDGTRLAEEPEAVIRLVDQCGGLPVALRVCGAQLASGGRSRSVLSLVGELDESAHRLSRVSGASEQGIAAVLDAAVSRLAPDARHAYRLLSLHPGRRIDARTAGALLGSSHRQVAELLDQLAAVSLIQPTNDGRFQFHDLVRLHAIAEAERVETDRVRVAATKRLVRWYTCALQVADRAVVDERLRLEARANSSGLDLPDLSGPSEAFEWFTRERDSILGVVGIASTMGWKRASCQLAEAMWSFCHDLRDYELWQTAFVAAAGAAAGLDSKAMEARARACLARAYSDQRRFEPAAAEIARAIVLAAESRHAWLIASVAEFDAIVMRDQGHMAAALNGFRRSKLLHGVAGSRRGEAIQDYHAGRCLIDMGRLAEAAALLGQACESFERLDDPVLASRSAYQRGEALRRLGDLDNARSSIEAAIRSVPHGPSSTYDEARAREVLAQIAADSGDADASLVELEAAFEIYRSLGHPRARTLFDEIGFAEAG